MVLEQAKWTENDNKIKECVTEAQSFWAENCIRCKFHTLHIKLASTVCLDYGENASTASVALSLGLLAAVANRAENGVAHSNLAVVNWNARPTNYVVSTQSDESALLHHCDHFSLRGTEGRDTHTHTHSPARSPINKTHLVSVAHCPVRPNKEPSFPLNDTHNTHMWCTRINEHRDTQHNQGRYTWTMRVCCFLGLWNQTHTDTHINTEPLHWCWERQHGVLVT